jgi:iron complex outermembrane receptor protein
VRVEWTPAASPSRSSLTSYTDGRRALHGGADAGTYGVDARRVGYAPTRLERVEVIDHDFTLRADWRLWVSPVDPVVISASRTEQTQLDAPASTSVIERDALLPTFASVHSSRSESWREWTTPRRDSCRNVRSAGPRGPNSGAMLMLTDRPVRRAAVDRLQRLVYVPTTREDIDRIEVVRGPARHSTGRAPPRGVLHVITRSPFESRGGGRVVHRRWTLCAPGTVRYAGVIHPPRRHVALGGLLPGRRLAHGGPDRHEKTG